MTDKPEIKHTPLPWAIHKSGDSFLLVGPQEDWHTVATVKQKVDAVFISRAAAGLEDAQATITELVEALEPLIELSWVKANLPDDLPVMVAAQDAVAKAKAQIDG